MTRDIIRPEILDWDNMKPLVCTASALLLGDCAAYQSGTIMHAYYRNVNTLTMRLNRHTGTIDFTYCGYNRNEKKIVFRLGCIAPPILYKKSAEGATSLFLTLRTPPRLLRYTLHTPQSKWDIWQVNPHLELSN